jgi:hypothetical protein
MHYGCITGIILLSHQKWFEKSDLQTPWAYAPLIQRVIGAVGLVEPIPFEGQLNGKKLEEKHWEAIRAQPHVMTWLATVFRCYSEKQLYKSSKISDISARSIKQPWNHLILCGIKTIENWDHEKIHYRITLDTPSIPIKYRCRWCLVG